MEVEIQYVDKLHPIFTKPKRIKIVLGGRGSTKSTGVADYVSVKMMQGELWCCAREQLNSIDESVHRTILDEIDRLGMTGFDSTKTSIFHESGGRCFYRGLSRNISSLKSSLSGVNGLWIEEGDELSFNTLRVLTASVRLNAKDTQRAMQGQQVPMPEIIITMNRGSRLDPISQKLLARAEPSLAANKYYEDELMMVVEMNYDDVPEDWFLLSGLEVERLDDKETMTNSEYMHKWHGKYLDVVENSIIKKEWFDACLDAHKIDRLKEAFEPKGAIISSHDPADTTDDKGYACRHGSIIKRVCATYDGEVDDGFDWAINLAIKDNADLFRWDGDGIGAGAKRQVYEGFAGKNINYEMFKGSLSGSGMSFANEAHDRISGENGKEIKTISEIFKNDRAHYYYELAYRCYNTYKCVKKGKYIDPDHMISFDSDGIDDIEIFRSQMCRIPRKIHSSNGLYQILSKTEMKKNKIESSGRTDSVMMTLKPILIVDDFNKVQAPLRKVKPQRTRYGRR